MEDICFSCGKNKCSFRYHKIFGCLIAGLSPLHSDNISAALPFEISDKRGGGVIRFLKFMTKRGGPFSDLWVRGREGGAGLLHFWLTSYVNMSSWKEEENYFIWLLTFDFFLKPLIKKCVKQNFSQFNLCHNFKSIFFLIFSYLIKLRWQKKHYANSQPSCWNRGSRCTRSRCTRSRCTMSRCTRSSS